VICTLSDLFTAAKRQHALSSMICRNLIYELLVGSAQDKSSSPARNGNAGKQGSPGDKAPAVMVRTYIAQRCR